MLNFDAGIFPCAITQIKLDLNITDSEFGNLGGIFYFGFAIACPFCAFLLRKFKRWMKWLIVVDIILCILFVTIT